MVRAVEKIQTWFLALGGCSSAVGAAGLNEDVGIGSKLAGLLQTVLHQKDG